MSEDLQPYQFGPGEWTVADWSRMRGEAPTLVEVGFPTREAAQRRCRELRASAERRMTVLVRKLISQDAVVVWRAYERARDSMVSVRRRHGAPGIDHPVDVAEEAYHVFGVRDAVVLAAALLHDVVEDTDLELNDLSDFPLRTTWLVDLLTKRDGQIRWGAIHTAPEAIVLKACDRIRNLRETRLVADGGSFARSYAQRTKRDMLQPGSPFLAHPVAGPLLVAEVELCEEYAG